MMEGGYNYNIEDLAGQRHDRVQTERPRIATAESCFDLVGSRQHGVASNEVISWSTDHSYSLNADGDDLRRNSNPNLCRLANVTCKTRDKGQQFRKNPEYHIMWLPR